MEQPKIATPKDFLSVANNSLREDSNLPRKDTPMLRSESLEEGRDVPAEASAATPTETSEEGASTRDFNRLLTPEEEREEYLKGLAKANITREDAIRIMDQVVTEGIYTESYKICNRVPVTFGTRTYRDLQRSAQLIDNADVNLPMHVNDLIARYNLAASLRSYGPKQFKFPSESVEATSEFHNRLELLYTLPEVVVNQLIQRLHEFDFKVGVVFSKGAPEDF